VEGGYTGGSVPLPGPEVHAYTDGASTGSRGPGGYGVVIRWEGKTKEISGGELNSTNLRMELTAACVALETIEEGYTVSVYSDASNLINCMRRGWYKNWRENGWLNYRKEPIANRDLWERLLQATQRHQQVRWRKVRDTPRPGARTRVATTGPTSSPWSPRKGLRDPQYCRHHDGRLLQHYPLASVS